MKIEDYTPGQYRVTASTTGLADDGEDYIRQLTYGLFRTLEKAREAIERDKEWDAKHRPDVLLGDIGSTTYVIHHCPGGWVKID